MTPSLPRRAAVAALACLITFLAACNRTPSAARDPQSAAGAFFAALEQGDPHSAYNGASFNFQAAQTFEAFLSNARELGLVGGQPPVWTGSNIQQTEARLDGTVVSQAGKTINISVTLTPDGKEWKLFSLRTSMGEAYSQPENRFTLVGKGAGFNDVYHQPMPSPKELADLVHGTMTRFNTAIKTGDFHDFYRAVSQQWKDGQRSSGAAAAGVTEKMIKDHFQGFADLKIDLSPITQSTPVFDRPPLINEDGLLVLDGHFDTPQFRVNFHLEYAYELPWWKLFGIDVSIMK